MLGKNNMLLICAAQHMQPRVKKSEQMQRLGWDFFKREDGYVNEFPLQESVSEIFRTMVSL